MKKAIVTMITILAVLCIIYNYTDVEASSRRVSPVVDFETTESTTEPTTESTAGKKKSSLSLFYSNTGESSETSEDAVTENEDYDNTQENDNTQNSKENEQSTDQTNQQSTKTNNDSSNLFSKTGKQAATELLNNSNQDILNDDYEFGDDILPKVETSNFFEHVYGKTWQVFSGLQKILMVILFIFFLFSVIMVGVSAFGRKERVVWYVLIMFLDMFLVVCVVYAPQIIASFSSWFTSN